MRSILSTVIVLTLLLDAGIATAGIFASDADAIIAAGSLTNTTHGTNPHLATKDAGGPGFDTTRKGYLRFDISDFPFTPDAASLELEIGFISAGGFNPNQPHVVNVYGLNDDASGQDWIESGGSGITWNNAPGNDTSSGNGVTSDATFLGTVTKSNLASVGFRMTLSNQSLLDFVLDDTDGLVTFIFTDATGIQSGAGIATKESVTANPPRLVLSSTVAPAVPLLSPAGLVALATTLVGLSAWAIRRHR